MLIALLTKRIVNPRKLAFVFMSDSEQLSRYRRLQRFFSDFEMDYDCIAGFIFKLFFISSGQWYLTVDRTNWKWGKSDINILTLAIAFKGAAIPIYWVLLDKRGNSDTAERIGLMQKFIKNFGKECIAGLLADREFIGEKWFKWLLDEGIPFHIRIKINTLTTNARGQGIDIDALYYGLKPGEQCSINDKRKIWGHDLYLAALRLEDNELLIIATDQPPEDAIAIYGLRWQIETLFGCLKGRGFNFEDTHIVNQERIRCVFVLLSIAFCWAHKTGERRNDVKPIKIKKHGRLSVSIFRYGLDWLINAINKASYQPYLIKECLEKIKIPQTLAISQVRS